MKKTIQKEYINKAAIFLQDILSKLSTYMVVNTGEIKTFENGKILEKSPCYLSISNSFSSFSDKLLMRSKSKAAECMTNENSQTYLHKWGGEAILQIINGTRKLIALRL